MSCQVEERAQRLGDCKLRHAMPVATTNFRAIYLMTHIPRGFNLCHPTLSPFRTCCVDGALVHVVLLGHHEETKP